MEERIVIPVEAPGLEETTNTVREMRKELVELRGQMAKAEGEEFVKLNKRASELNAQMARTNSLITSSGSNFTNFNTILGRTTRALLTLDFGAAADGAAQLQSISKKLTFKEMLSGLRLATRAIWQMTAAILANPLGLLAAAAVGLVVAVVALKDDIPFLTQAFEFLSGVLDTVISLFKNFTDSIGLTQFALKDYTNEVLNSSDLKINAMREEFRIVEAGLQNEITLRRAAGQSTLFLETQLRNEKIRLLNEELILNRNNLRALDDLTKAGIKLTDEQIDKQKEFTEAIKDTGFEIEKLKTENSATEIKINMEKMDMLRRQEEEYRRFMGRMYDLDTQNVSAYLSNIDSKYIDFQNKRFKLQRELNKSSEKFTDDEEKRITIINNLIKSLDEEKKKIDENRLKINELQNKIDKENDLIRKISLQEERDALIDLTNEEIRLYNNRLVANEVLFDEIRLIEEKGKLREKENEKIKEGIKLQLDFLNDKTNLFELGQYVEGLSSVIGGLIDTYKEEFVDVIKNLNADIMPDTDLFNLEKLEKAFNDIKSMIDFQGQERLNILKIQREDDLKNLKEFFMKSKGLKEEELENDNEYKTVKARLSSEYFIKENKIKKDADKSIENLEKEHKRNLLEINKEWGELWTTEEDALLEGRTNKWQDHHNKITDLNNSSTARMLNNSAKLIKNTSAVFSQLENIYQNEADTLFRNAMLKGDLDKRDIKRIKRAEKRQRDFAKASLALDLATATGNTYVAATKAAAAVAAKPPAAAIAFTTTLATILPKVIGGFAQLKAINNQPSLTDGVGGGGGAISDLNNNFNNQISGIPNFSLFQSGIGDTTSGGGQINQTFILESELLSAEERRRVLLNKGSL